MRYSTDLLKALKSFITSSAFPNCNVETVKVKMESKQKKAEQ
jgi:hypothetical protein|tara:strand:- start:2267 stop:2392 length:126 start_codon:yes stop_codon:yes gene_type:complete